MRYINLRFTYLLTYLHDSLGLSDNPNGISIGSAAFAGLTSVTDRQTDRQTTLLFR